MYVYQVALTKGSQRAALELTSARPASLPALLRRHGLARAFGDWIVAAYRRVEPTVEREAPTPRPGSIVHRVA